MEVRVLFSTRVILEKKKSCARKFVSRVFCFCFFFFFRSFATKCVDLRATGRWISNERERDSSAAICLTNAVFCYGSASSFSRNYQV